VVEQQGSVGLETMPTSWSRHCCTSRPRTGGSPLPSVKLSPPART